MSDSTISRRAMVLNLEAGLHIRACSQVVALASNSTANLKLNYNGQSGDASSMFELLQLAVLPDAEVVAEATGEGAEELLDRLEALFSLQVLP